MKNPRPEVPSTHPVAPEVRARVLEALDEIERQHDVAVLFACESGSRGWGFASPDSDYDVRFVYAHRLPWYLTVEPRRDVIELPISDELDISGWELRKALRLLRKSNPTLFEWLDSPVVYREQPAVTGPLRALAPAYFSAQRGRYHYLAMARKNFRGYLQGERVRLKKYLYVLRPLLAVRWIDRGMGRPPMRFADLVAGTLEDRLLLEEIDALLEHKMRAGEAEYGHRRPRIHAFTEGALEQAEREPAHRRPVGDAMELDAFLMATVLALSDGQD